jgi:hypothetical protein
MTRVCNTCGKEKPLTTKNFWVNGRRTGFRPKCVACCVEVRSRFYDTHPGEHEKKRQTARRWRIDNAARFSKTRTAWRKAHPRSKKSTALKARYGITIDEYEERIAQQGGGCAICGSETAGNGNRNLHVDHCHKTGEVRGVLCHSCNVILGLAKDQPEILQRAALYLRA